MMSRSKWCGAMLAIGLLASAAVIAAGERTPVADVTPPRPTGALLGAQAKPAIPTDDCGCGGAPEETLVVAQGKSGTAAKSAEKAAGSEGRVPCPLEMIISQMAPPAVVPTPHLADFPMAIQQAAHANFGGTQTNKQLIHTFTWKSKSDCCQYLSGTLTLHYKALQGGLSDKSSDAGNDAMGIYSNGTALQGLKLYTGHYPFNTGLTLTKAIALTPAVLDKLGNGRFSFVVEDDTQVISAKLELTACCVKHVTTK